MDATASFQILAFPPDPVGGMVEISNDFKKLCIGGDVRPRRKYF